MIRFKKGDKVRVVDNGHLDEFQGTYTGCTGIVQEDDDNPFVLMGVDGRLIAFRQDKLELIKDKPKFNKGDRVVVINAEFRIEEEYVGSTGVVQEDDDSCPFVLMDIDEEELVFCQRQLMSFKDFFKPGDKVKILGTGNDFLKQYIGTIGEL